MQETTYFYEEDPIEPIESSNPIQPTARRDYLPRGYKRWNRCNGSHFGLKQFKKQTLKLIKASSTETLSARINELQEISIAPAEFNPKVDRERLAWTIKHMLAEYHCRILSQKDEITPEVPNLPS